MTGILLLTSLPASTASVAQSPFNKPCYGSTTGWGYVYWSGSDYGGGPWSGNYTAGKFTGPFLSAQAGAYWGSNNSSIEDRGWASHGLGAKKTSCFRIRSSSSTLRFVFSDFNFTVNLSLSCAKTNSSSISASYNISIAGELYDFSAAHNVWSSVPSELVRAGTVTCVTGHGGKFSRSVNLTHPVTLRLNATGLTPSDQYWFSAGVAIGVQAHSPVTKSSAGAYFSSFSARLAEFGCTAC